ncbi:hypothetical protein AB6A40_003135 [Gnathostoma spinigerum]|uniref:Histone acetyltransferase n=1 Tax=Gnathostoma spinigerum TaxID=75299 RepID=A0ABD6EB55_9BILA
MGRYSLRAVPMGEQSSSSHHLRNSKKFSSSRICNEPIGSSRKRLRLKSESLNVTPCTSRSIKKRMLRSNRFSNKCFGSTSPQSHRATVVKPENTNDYSPIKTRGLVKKEEKEANLCTECRKAGDDVLISCMSCDAQYHLLCLGYTEQVAASVNRKRKTNWLCPKCIVCEICKAYIDDETNVQCTECDRAYHGVCRPVTTTIPAYPLIQWLCELCMPKTSVAIPKKENLSSNSNSSTSSFQCDQSVRRLSLKSRKYFVSGYENEFWLRRQRARDEINDALKEECEKRLRDRNRQNRTKRYEEMSAKWALSRNPSLSPKMKRDRLFHTMEFVSFTTAQRNTKKEKGDILEELEKLEEAIQKEKQVYDCDGGDEEAVRNERDGRMREITTDFDYDFYQSVAEEYAKKKLDSSPVEKKENRVQWICFGDGRKTHAVNSSPYPKEIANSEYIYICRYCLTAVEDGTKFAVHRNSCEWRFPPGNEIYRENSELAFWEIDGEDEKAYCRRLCLMSKLFLSSKTLHHEVDAFLFYILTEITSDGYAIVGYFSKEKHPSKNNNLSCLLTLPSSQRNGYGRFLIDLSYKLALRERKIGGPEHPLSSLGLVTYRSYWKAVIIAYIRKRRFTAGTSLSIRDMSYETAIYEKDIIDTLLVNGMLRELQGGTVMIRANKAYRAPLHSFRRKVIRDELLIWKPEFDVDRNPLKMGNYMS